MSLLSSPLLYLLGTAMNKHFSRKLNTNLTSERDSVALNVDTNGQMLENWIIVVVSGDRPPTPRVCGSVFSVTCW